MGYPLGAGPQAGHFSGLPPTAYAGPQARGATRLPHILTARGKDVIGPDGMPMTDKTVATLGSPRSGRAWLIQRVTVSASGASPAWLYVGGTTPDYLVTGTGCGQMDTYDAVPPIPVRAGEVVTVVWRYDRIVEVGQCVARIEYWEVDA